jgi:hypothetical protein
MVRRLSTFTIAFALVLAAPALASDVDAIGGTPSVAASHSHGQIVIVFTGARGKRLYGQVAGRRVAIECEQSVSKDPELGAFPGASEIRFKVPKKGHKLHAGSPSDADWCQVLRFRHGHLQPVVAVALTNDGKVFLDERLRAVELFGLLNALAPDNPSANYPTTSEAVAKLHGAVIGLANPGDSPPPGQFGVFSDGARHIEMVATSAAGRRLFYDVNGDTVSSNILGHLGSV